LEKEQLLLKLFCREKQPQYDLALKMKRMFDEKITEKMA